MATEEWEDKYIPITARARMTSTEECQLNTDMVCAHEERITKLEAQVLGLKRVVALMIEADKIRDELR